MRTLSDFGHVERVTLPSNMAGSVRDFLPPFLIGMCARSVKVLVPRFGGVGTRRPTVSPGGGLIASSARRCQRSIYRLRDIAAGARPPTAEIQTTSAHLLPRECGM